MKLTVAVARATPVILLLALAGCGSTGYRHAYVQGMLGANAVGSGQVEFTKLPGDLEEDPSENLPTAPMLAFAGQQPLTGEREYNAGVEFGGTFTWWYDDVDIYGYAGGGGALVVIDFDNRMWMSDFFVGPYGSLLLGEKIRIYGGAGPTLVYAGIDYESEFETEDGTRVEAKGYDDDWSWGVYARVGVEYQMDRANLVGVGARWLRTELQFGDLDTELTLETWQIYASFTTKF